MEKIINKRLEFYSKDKNSPVSLSSLIPNSNMKSEVLKLADYSPRLLIQLLGCICSNDNREKFDAFSMDAIAKGMMQFCKNFDYVSLRPFKTGGNSDLKDWINKLLSVRRTSFTVPEYTTITGVGKSSAYKHIESLQRLELIRKQSIQNETGAEIYEVFDPRIIHLISRGITNLE